MIGPKTLANKGLHPKDELELLDFYLSVTTAERKALFASTANASDDFGISQRTLQRWIEEGSILAIRAGGKYQVYLPAVEGYIAGCSSGSVSENIVPPLRLSQK